jgi:hypothetical protein
MNKWKIGITLMVAALCLLPGWVFADGRISLKLQGGWAYISAGDVNPGTQAYFDWETASWPPWDGRYLAVHSGYELGGTLIFDLNRTLGIGIGVEYLKSSRTSRMVFSGTYVWGGLSAEPKLTAIPIRLGLFLNAPLRGKINFTANAGVSYYFQARYSDRWYFSYGSGGWVTESMQTTTRAEKKGIPLGLDGGLGIEYKLTRRIFLCMDVRGRYARFRGLRGTTTVEEYDEVSGTPTTLSETGKLYYESVPMLTGSPRLIMVQSDPPAGPGGVPRQAVVDFSGVSLQLGIRIRL